jgi:hypothetical protein
VQIIKRDDTAARPDVAKRLALDLVTQDKIDALGSVAFSNNAIGLSVRGRSFFRADVADDTGGSNEANIVPAPSKC